MEPTKESWNWNGYRAYEKLCLAIGWILYVPALAALVLEVLKAFEVLKLRFDALLLGLILMAVSNELMTVGFWRRNRNMAIIFLSIAFVCAIRVLIRLL